MHGQQNVILRCTVSKTSKKYCTTYSGFNFGQVLLFFLLVFHSGLTVSNPTLLSNKFRRFHSQGKTGRSCDTKHTDPSNGKFKTSWYENCISHITL